MTYSQLFANAGVPMPAQFTQFANIEIPADQLPAYLQQYPPVAQPQAPAAPAPAAVPPAPAMPGAPVAAAAPVANTGFDRSNSWPSVFIPLTSLEEQGMAMFDLNDPVESRQHPGMMVPRAMLHDVKFGNNKFDAVAYTSTKRDAAGNVIGYLTVAECDSLIIAQDPAMPGKFSCKLTKGGYDRLMAKAVRIKAKPSFNWAALAVDAEAAD